MNEENTNIKPMNRREERELALRGIFQIDFHPEAADRDLSIKNFFENAGHGDKEDEVSGVSSGYAERIVLTVKNHLEEIDHAIETRLKADWSMKRLPHLEKAVMRLSAAEMMYMRVPKEVAINEGLELVKQYGEMDNTSFVNGILNQIATQYAKPDKEAE